MKNKELIIAAIIVVAFGTGMHFVHELPFFNHFLGYIFPVNECVWEHMKMVFYPMFLLSLYFCISRKDIRQFGGPILASVIAIPAQIALFYCYWPFTHHSVLILDIILYTAVMVAATVYGEKWSRSESVRKHYGIWIAVAVAMIVLLAYLTYNPLDMIFFVLE